MGKPQPNHPACPSPGLKGMVRRAGAEVFADGPGDPGGARQSQTTESHYLAVRLHTPRAWLCPPLTSLWGRDRVLHREQRRLQQVLNAPAPLAP